MMKHIYLSKALMLSTVLVALSACTTGQQEDIPEAGEIRFECGGISLADAESVDEYGELDVLLAYREYAMENACPDEGDIHYWVGHKFLAMHEEIARVLGKPIPKVIVVAAGISVEAEKFCSARTCKTPIEDILALKALSNESISVDEYSKDAYEKLLSSGWKPDAKTAFYPRVGIAYLLMLADEYRWEELDKFLSEIEDEEFKKSLDFVFTRIDGIKAENIDAHYSEFLRQNDDTNLLVSMCAALRVREEAELMRDCYGRVLASPDATPYQKVSAEHRLAELADEGK